MAGGLTSVRGAAHLTLPLRGPLPLPLKGGEGRRYYRKNMISPRTLTFTGSSLFGSVNLIVQERVVGPANPAYLELSQGPLGQVSSAIGHERAENRAQTDNSPCPPRTRE